MKILYLLPLFQLLTFVLFAQENKIIIRPIVGNGHGYISERTLLHNDPDIGFSVDYKFSDIRKTRFENFLHEVIVLPQIGLMLEYQKGRHTFSFGAGQGKNKFAFRYYINDYFVFGARGSSGKFWKTSIEYGYRFLPFILKRISLHSHVSFSRISNDLTNWDIPGNTVTVDANGFTRDSIYDNDYVINKHGWLFSVSLRAAYHKKNRKEIVSMVVSYDQGLTDLVASEVNIYFAYLDNYLKSRQVSKGSQFKFMISVPINLFDLNKDKFGVFK